MKPATAPTSAATAAELFRTAAELNRSDPCRKQNVLHFPNYGQVVMTGDLHGHVGNFDKLRRYARLADAPTRHVMLHELIHIDTLPGAADASHYMLLDAARYKCEFPDQVHFLQSNHELSQLTGHNILKNGRAVVDDFRRSVLDAYGAGGPRVYDAILELLASYPIAARTPNRVWLSHALPASDEMARFDRSIFDRDIKRLDYEPGGPIYQLVWGRRFTPDSLDEFARITDADLFVMGHIPQESGYDVRLGRILILASDHSHGVFLPIDLARPCTTETLVEHIRKYVAVA